MPAILAALALAAPTQLKAQPAPLGLCQTVVASYKEILAADAHARFVKSFYPDSPLTVLAAKAKSGIVIAPHIAEIDKSDAPQDWQRRQKPPLAMPSSLRDAVGKSDFIDRLPHSGFYAASRVEGTAHCYNSTYFEVKHGGAELSPGPGNWDDDEGAGCGISRAFGQIGATPAAFREDYDYSPALTSSLSISGWRGDHFGPACTISFRFAPRFAAQGTYDAREQSCSAPNCSALRKAALGLVETVQTNAHEAETGLLNKLTSAQRAAFLTMKSDAHIKPPETAARNGADDPADITDMAPLALPLVIDNQLYLAFAGHFTIGWRTFSDWSVKIDQRNGKDLKEVAALAIGMTKGNLAAAEVK
jgi:hypothetical protein